MDHLLAWVPFWRWPHGGAPAPSKALLSPWLKPDGKVVGDRASRAAGAATPAGPCWCGLPAVGRGLALASSSSTRTLLEKTARGSEGGRAGHTQLSLNSKAYTSGRDPDWFDHSVRLMRCEADWRVILPSCFLKSRIQQILKDCLVMIKKKKTRILFFKNNVNYYLNAFISGFNVSFIVLLLSCYFTSPCRCLIWCEFNIIAISELHIKCFNNLSCIYFYLNPLLFYFSLFLIKFMT